MQDWSSGAWCVQLWHSRSILAGVASVYPCVSTGLYSQLDLPLTLGMSSSTRLGALTCCQPGCHS
jgi:hypothetical protein